LPCSITRRWTSSSRPSIATLSKSAAGAGKDRGAVDSHSF
jgi:hypothetical protein